MPLNKKSKRIEQRIAFIKKRLQKVMSFRLVLAAVFIVNLYLLSQTKTFISFGLLILTTIAFIYLVRWTYKIRHHLSQLQAYFNFNQRVLLRQMGEFSQTSDINNDLLSAEDQITSSDLHYVGSKSLLNLLDETSTFDGRKQLLNFILRPQLNSEQLKIQQKKFKDFSSYWWKLVRFRLLGHQHKTAVENNFLITTLQTSTIPKNFNMFFFFSLLAFIITWSLIIYALVVPNLYHPILPLYFYFFFSLITSKYVSLSFGKAQSFSKQLESLSPLFIYIESNFKADIFRKDLSTLLDEKPSKHLKRINFLITMLSVQANPIIHIVLNSLMPWDFTFTFFVEQWRKKFSKHFPQMLQELNNFEVSLSCSLFYKFQTQTFPEFSQEPQLNFKNIYHPLIAKKQVVANSFTMPPGKRLGLITGSNMAGKSTFLRTIGVNQTLALMGCPVYADFFNTYLAPVKTCLKISDSLEEGYSTFYYEVKRIADIIQRSKNSERFIYLVDEIFRGTNNRERLIGSKNVVYELIKHPQIIGFISTHDLELATLENGFQEVGNWHFRDDINNKHLSFSYQIQDGSCPSTNALKIISAAGIEIKELQNK